MEKRKAEETLVHVNLVKLKNVNGIERFYYSFEAAFTGFDVKCSDEKFYYYIKGHVFKDGPSSSDILFCCTEPDEAWAFMQALERQLEQTPPYLYDVMTWDLIDPEGTVYPGGMIPA